MSINLDYSEITKLLNDREYFNKKDLPTETRRKLEKMWSFIDKMEQDCNVVENLLKDKFNKKKIKKED